jgi:hypothetical protein
VKKRAAKTGNAEGSRCSARSFLNWLEPVDESQGSESGELEGQDAKVASKSKRGRTYLIARQVRELGTKDPKVRRNEKDERGGSKP